MNGNHDTALLQRDMIDDKAFDHGAISRFNSWFFNAFETYINRIAEHHKTQALRGISGTSILEIGAGTGANFSYVPDGARLYAVEPSLRMHDRLRAKAASAGVELTVLGTGAEQIPLPDNSMDEVVATLVLCTVDDPGAVLAEVRRVLRPGGSFRFVEHVAAGDRTLRRKVQRWIRRPWGWLFEGCNPALETPALVEAAGFDEVTIERRMFRRSLFYPVNTAAWGMAR